MAGFRHKSFQHDCNERGCYIEGLPSWDFLDGAFPRGIIPTDIDGMVEVNKHFLFLEEKRAGAFIKPGQLSAFRALSCLSNVKVALTRPGEVSGMQLLVLDGGRGTGWQDVSRHDYFAFCQTWSDHADSTDPEPSTDLRRENARLVRDNEMLRRQLKALIEGGTAA